MAEETHPILGGVFIVGAVALIGYAAYAGMHAGHAGPAEDAPPASSAGHNESAKIVSEAIQLGRKGDLQGARNAFEVVLEKEPNNTDALYNLGVALTGLGEREQAEKTFERVLELEPNDSEALAELAGLKKDAGKLDDALSYLERIKPNDGKIQLRLQQDPLWQDVGDDPRMVALKKKHGLAN